MLQKFKLQHFDYSDWERKSKKSEGSFIGKSHKTSPVFLRLYQLEMILLWYQLTHFSIYSPYNPDTDADSGVSILMSYGENPHYVKLPIFSEIMENSTKFMENSDLTKWTQNLS